MFPSDFGLLCASSIGFYFCPPKPQKRSQDMVVLPVEELSRRTFFSFREENVIETVLSLDANSFYCTVNGNVVPNFRQCLSEFSKDDFFQVHFRLAGGKGGFGSLLRSFRVNKSTNQLMCRDLNGRRLASIDEEEKLKKWIARAAEREREKIAKKKAKYEKLKSGPPKHMFNDPDYIRQKEEIIEKTEEAFETGFLELTKTEREKKSQPDESSSDSDFDIDDLPGSRAARKRKAVSATGQVEQKKQKIEEDVDSSSDSDENDVDLELLREIQGYFACKSGECSTSKGDDQGICNESDSGNTVEEPAAKENDNNGELRVESTEDSASDVSENCSTDKNEVSVSAAVSIPPAKPHEPEDFPPVDLTLYEDPSELEKLGLGHLKHALKARGMKCGGTLRERAERLFSSKNMSKED